MGYDESFAFDQRTTFGSIKTGDAFSGVVYRAVNASTGMAMIGTGTYFAPTAAGARVWGDDVHQFRVRVACVVRVPSPQWTRIRDQAIMKKTHGEPFATAIARVAQQKGFDAAYGGDAYGLVLFAPTAQTVREVRGRTQPFMREALSYDAETELIRTNKRSSRAHRRHKFQRARWTHPNYHPRCLICGDEPGDSAYCEPLAEQASPPVLGRESVPSSIARRVFHEAARVWKRPRTVYHGTDSLPFTVFDPLRAEKTRAGRGRHFNPLGNALYVTNRPEFARFFGARVYEVNIPSGTKARTYPRSEVRETALSLLRCALMKTGVDWQRDVPLRVKADIGGAVSKNTYSIYLAMMEAVTVCVWWLGDEWEKKNDEMSQDLLITRFYDYITDCANTKFGRYDVVIFQGTNDPNENVYGYGHDAVPTQEILIFNPALQRTARQVQL